MLNVQIHSYYILLSKRFCRKLCWHFLQIWFSTKAQAQYYEMKRWALSPDLHREVTGKNKKKPWETQMDEHVF